MNPVWKLREDNQKEAEAVALQSENLGLDKNLPQLIRNLISVRGITSAELAEKLLFPKLSELKDPLSIKGMSLAVERVASAFLNKEKICIYADFDLDGTSGLALLKTGLVALGFENVIHYQPKRLSEGYGFHAHAVDELHSQGVKLIITVDVGITANAAVERANNLGLEVIITDHHLPSEVIPPALVVVNPNQPTCESGLNYLCGAGVAFYLLRALKRYFHDHPSFPRSDWDLKEVLDYFTIGTLTDMVPLVDDNRVLVKHGLLKLAETKKFGLKALLEELDLVGRPLTSQDVAIRFAPKLNALSRMESGILPVDIFLLSEASKAQDMIRQVMKNNSTRVQLQSDAESLAQELLVNWTHNDFVFVVSKNFHRGVVGLIATKLTQLFNKPAFVGSLDDDGMIVGSARLPQGQEICLVEAMTSAADLMNRFGGHSAAAGFEISEVKLNLVVERLSEYFAGLREKPKPLQIEYDVEAQLSDINSGLMKWYDFVGPFGAGFSVPLLLFKQVEVISKRDLKGGHQRLRLSQNDENFLEALLFTPTHRQMTLLEEVPGKFDILGELQWNYFGGQKSIQILVRDLKVSK